MEHGKIIKKGRPSEVFLAKSKFPDGILLYGTVLSVEPQGDYLNVCVIIKKSACILKVPLEQAEKAIPGRSFLINYSLESPDIKFLD